MTKVAMNLTSSQRLEVVAEGMEAYDVFRSLSSVFAERGIEALKTEAGKFGSSVKILPLQPFERRLS